MAYNKSKGKQKHGDVIYDKDTDTQIDFEQNEIKFRTGGSVRGSFTNGGLSVTGSHIIVGEISSSLGYSGSTGYFNREVIAGFISGTSVQAPAGYFDVFASPNNGVANARTIITSGGILSSSQTTALNALDIGEGTFTVNKEGVVASSGSISGASLTSTGIVSGSTVTANRAEIGQLTASAGLHVTGSNPKLSIGDKGGENPNDGMLFVRPSDTNNRALCLMQGKESDGNRVIFAVTGSGQVIVGGGYFGGVLSISGSTAEKLISAKSDSLSPAFEVAGNGNTTVSGILSASQTPTINALDVGEGTFIVSKEGAVASSGSISGTVLSGSSTATLHSLNVGQGVFTVSNEGAVVGASLDNSNGGITNAGSIAGATTIDGSGDLTMGTITMTGFSVDADGDTNVKSLVSEGVVTAGGIVSGSSVTANSAKFNIIGSDQLTTTLTLEQDNVIFQRGLSGSNHGYPVKVAGAFTSSQGGFQVSATGKISSSATTNDFLGSLSAAGGGFTVDNDGDVVAKSLTLTAGSTLSASKGEFNEIEVYEIGGDGNSNIILKTGLTGSNTYPVQIRGSFTSSGGAFAISSGGIISSSAIRNDFLGSLSAGGGGFTVDSDGDVVAKSLTLTAQTTLTSSKGEFNEIEVYELGGDQNSDIILKTGLTGSNTYPVQIRGAFTSSAGKFTISSGGIISSSAIRNDFLGSLSAGGGGFTVDNDGDVVARTLSAGGGGFTVDNDGDVVVKTLTITDASGVLTGSKGEFNEVEVNELDADGGSDIILKAGLTGSSFSPIQIRGSFTSSAGRFTISNLGIISSSASKNHFLGTLEAGGGGFTVDSDGDLVAKSVTTPSLNVVGGIALSGAAIQAHAVTASFIGPQFNADLFTLLRPGDGPSVFAGPFSGSGPKTYAFDWPGLVRLAGNTVRFTHKGTGSMQQLIVSGNIEASSRAIIGTGITASANQFHVAGDSGDIFTAGRISGSGPLDVGGDIRARHGSLTMAGTLNLGGGNIINASGVSGSGNVTFGGKLEMLGKQFKIDNQADLSSSGDIEIYGKLEVGGENFIVQQDGDVSGSGYAYFGGKLEAAARAFRVDSDGDTIVKSLSSSQAVTAQNFAADGAVAAGGNVSGAVLSGSSTATLYALNIGQGAMTVSKEGSLRAKQIHMTSHKFTPGNSTAHFVRFDTNGGDTVQNDNNKLTAPYSGKLIKVAARATNAAGSTVISLHTNVDGAQNVNGTATEAITVDMSAANTTYTFTFTDSANYGPGDIVGIKFDPTNDPGTPTLTAVWEFDHNS